MIYKERLSLVRERIGLTQKEIASSINMEYSHYRHCEKEDELFPIKHLNNICNCLNISFDYIFNLSSIQCYENNLKDIDKDITSKRLKEFRKENKLTLVKLGKILNISYGTLAGYEQGRYIIATPFLYTICRKYHISADYLLGKVDEPKYLK